MESHAWSGFGTVERVEFSSDGGEVVEGGVHAVADVAPKLVSIQVLWAARRR